jgi:hypothetical protein
MPCDEGVRESAFCLFWLESLSPMVPKQQSKSSVSVPMDRRAEALAVLYEISRTLASGWEMAPMIAQVLALLDRRLPSGMACSFFSIHRQMTCDRGWHGLTQEERARGRYRIGGALPARCSKMENALLIPDLSGAAIFKSHDPAGFFKEVISMLAVPVKFSEEKRSAS